MYVYGLYEEGTERILYVGLTTKTINKRLVQHRKAATRGGGYRVHAWMRSVGPERVLSVEVDQVDSVEDLLLSEIYWIQSLSTHVSVGGTNMTWGGEWGNVWDALTPEQQQASRDRMRDVQKMQTATPEAAALRSDLSTQTISELNNDPEFTARKAERFRVLWQDPDWAERNRKTSSKTMTEKWATDSEYVEKMRALNAERWSDPEKAEKSAAALREGINDMLSDPVRRAEYVESVREGARKRAATAEGKEHLRMASRKGTHVQHHVNKNKTVPSCELCFPYPTE